MKPLSILFFFNLIFLSDNNNNKSLVDAVDEFFKTCNVPTNCGNQSISFPFYIQGIQQHYCGFPGFQISCDHDGTRPILNLSGDDYVIRNIFYHNRSLIVSNAAFNKTSPDSDTVCIPYDRNVSLQGDHFKLDLNESRVFLLYNCRKSSSSSSSCFGRNSTVALGGKEEAMSEMGKCPRKDAVVVEVPVLNWALPRGGMIGREVAREGLSKGFMLNWIASDCGRCNSTGGRCGFDYESLHFKCYCPDRPHAARCDPPGQSFLFSSRPSFCVSLVSQVRNN